MVVGRSDIVGKPLAMLLARPGVYANATVTICHSRTTPEILREAGKNADVLITAVGRANFLTRDLTGEDQIILDVRTLEKEDMEIIVRELELL